MADLAGASPEEIEDAIAEALTKLASQGSVPAANAALKLVEQRRQSASGAAHRERLDALASDPAELCRYLGEIGESKSGTTDILGRELKVAEKKARMAGSRARQSEIRAIELARARSGGSIERWMRS